MPKWYFGSILNLPEDLVKSQDQWIFQWKRVQRYYERANKLRKKYEYQELSDYDIDDIISFFMSAFHLKEWIKESHKGLVKDLEQLFKKFEMGCCKDIANGFKHKKLSRPSIEADFNLLREYDYDAEAIGRNPIRDQIAFWDENIQDIRKWDIFELVDIVYEHWQKFIAEKLKKSLNMAKSPALNKKIY
ncbi:MAG: hypothetical protein AB1668_06700 [Nanoarchaeota archaeon]